MLKSRRFKRKAVCLGLTATLIAGFAVTFVVPTAANICRELNMAGISLSLDKFSSNNKDSIINSSVSQPAQTATEASVSATPEATTEATAEPVKKKAPKKNDQPKRVDKGLVTDMDVKAISTASDYVHVRRKPNTHSKIVGRLYRGCSADVLKTKNGWAKIRSGNVTGYIKKSYLAIGDDAKKMIGKYGQKYVRVKTSVVTLNVRKKADIKSKILTQIPIEENYDVIKSTDHWYKIEIDGDTKGYVRKEYVTLQEAAQADVLLHQEAATAHGGAQAAHHQAVVQAHQVRHQQVDQQDQISQAMHRSLSAIHTDGVVQV